MACNGFVGPCQQVMLPGIASHSFWFPSFCCLQGCAKANIFFSNVNMKELRFYSHLLVRHLEKMNKSFTCDGKWTSSYIIELLYSSQPLKAFHRHKVTFTHSLQFPSPGHEWRQWFQSKWLQKEFQQWLLKLSGKEKSESTCFYCRCMNPMYKQQNESLYIHITLHTHNLRMNTHIFS